MTKSDISLTSRFTHMVAQFGQFLDHDMGLTLEEEGECCPRPHSMACMNIEIPKNDPFYSKRRTRSDCHPFLRSAACAKRRDYRGFSSDYLEQVNAITHLLGVLSWLLYECPYFYT